MIRTCTTLKEGVECRHMGKKGCTYTNGQCNEIEEKCEGCDHVQEIADKKYCDTYASPAYMWKDDDCLGATHVERKITSAAEQFVNPLKASKRASRGG